MKNIIRKKSLIAITGILVAGALSVTQVAASGGEGSEIYGYYGQAVEASMDLKDTILIGENDDATDQLETTLPQVKTLVATSYEIDQQVQAEQENGYTWEEPLTILNPYQISPLTAVILFDTEEECGVRFTVKGKTEAADISGEVGASVSHRIPVIRSLPGDGQYRCLGTSGQRWKCDRLTGDYHYNRGTS